MSLGLEKIGSDGFGKRPKDFPKVNDDNVDKIEAGFESLEDSIGGGGGLSERVSDLEDRSDVNESNIDSLENRADTTESRLDTNESDIDSLENRADTTESRLDTNESDIDVAQSDIEDLKTLVPRVAQNEDDIQILYSEISNVVAASGSLDGVAHVTDVTSTGNIEKAYLTDTNNSVIGSFSTDTSNVTLEITSRSFTFDWLPKVKVNGLDVSGFTEQSDGKFQVDVPVSLSGSSELEVAYEFGSIHRIPYTVATEGPSISLIELDENPALPWDGGTLQTHLKENDTISISGACDPTTTYVEVIDSGIFKSGSTSVTLGETTFVVEGVVSDRTGTHVATLRARNSLGTYGSPVSSIETKDLDQTIPQIGSFSVSYPASQGALKDSETGTVTCSVTDFTSIEYTSNGELNIGSSSTYELNKLVGRASGDYNVSSPNFSISTRKDSNGTTNVQETVVFIANVDPVIDASTPASRLRSGGNDGTSVQNHTITVNSNQRLLSFEMEEQNTYGAFTDSWGGASNNTVWTRTLQVSDNDSKGSGAFNSVVATGLSGKTTTTLNSGTSYTLGGFVSRSLTLAAFANTVAANVDAVDYSKVTLVWSFKTLTNKRSLGTTTVPDPNSWALTTLTPASVIVLDTAAAGSSSQASTITLEETI